MALHWLLALLILGALGVGLYMTGLPFSPARLRLYNWHKWVGMVILIYRRRTVGPVFSATTVMDKVMYAFLAAAIVLGMWNTIAGSILTLGGEYNYREGVSVWYRSFLAFQPDADLMAKAPFGFQLHALVAFGLFALWPFTRLVHVFSAPVGYLTRPYIVYRSRDDHLGSHRPRRGWDQMSKRI